MPRALAGDLRRLVPSSEKQIYDLLTTASRGGHLSKESSKRLCAYFDDHGITCGHPLFPAWKAIAINDAIHFEKVVEVVKTGRRETGHDLTVPGYETFMSVDGIILSNTMSFHVPASGEAVAEVARKMMPSQQLLSTSQFKAHFIPRQEFALGLWQASRGSNKKAAAKVYAGALEALADFQKGRLHLDSVVDIPEPDARANVMGAIRGLSR
jgi:hypothetical protein